MWWRKRGSLRQSIESDEGQITLTSGLFFVLFLFVLLIAQLQLEMFRSSSAYLEDAPAASGLASAVVDIREYGYSHTVMIKHTDEAYEKYRSSLKVNLGLDDNWVGNNKNLISGKVKIENYTIYNVKGNMVEICRLDRGKQEVESGALGEICALNGQEISHTGIYSEISFPVQGLFGIKLQAHKGKLVDIIGQE